MATDPHRLLGVPRDASADEIRAAYRRLAKRAHPDRPGGDAAAFARLQSAYEAALAPRAAHAPPDRAAATRAAGPVRVSFSFSLRLGRRR